MKDINTLFILQYNMQNNQVKIIIPLLANLKGQDYNIIAVQEL